MSRCVPITLLAGLCAASLGGGRPIEADEISTPPADAIFVKTELVAATGDVPDGLVRTVGLPVSFDFIEDDGFPVGQMSVGARRLLMALLRGRGSEAALLVDLNGDGRPSRADESFPITVAPWMVRDQAVGLLWKSTVTWGTGSFALTIRDRIGALNGQWTAQPEGADSPSTTPVALAFDPDVPASVSKPPATAARVRYATFSSGERTVVVAALRGARDEMSFLVDSSSSGDLSDVTHRIVATARPLKRGAIRTGTSWSSDPIEILGVKGVLTALESLPSIQASADPTSSRCGTTNVAGDPFTLVLLDGDFDGSYAGPSDWWGFAPASSVDAPNPNKLFEGDRPCWRNATRAWRLVGVKADGTAILAPYAKAPSVEAYLRERGERVDAQRWFPKFEVEREEFFRAQGIAPTRPKVETPFRWHHALTFEDARALAKSEGKPLLVDFEADWCVWCKRLSWAVYPDRDVAERLSKFTAVKVNVELDPTAGFQSIPEFEGAGLPAVAVFDSAGHPVSFKPTWDKPKSDVVNHIDGFKRPDEFAAALDAALAAVNESRKSAGGGGGTDGGAPPAPGTSAAPK